MRQDCCYVIPDFVFENGKRLDVLRLSYFTIGELSPARDNAILLCPNASGSKDWALPFIGEGGAFDPSRFFLICVDAIGSGRSSKPSDGLGIDFPKYTVSDLVRTQFHLVTQHLALPSLYAVAGPSMASLIGFEWAFRFPELVRSLVLWAPGVRCDAFGRAMIDAIIAVIELDSEYENGRYTRQPNEGLRRAGMVFFPHLLSRELLDGISEDELNRLRRAIGDSWAASWDANDLIFRYSAIATCDLPLRHGGLEVLARGIRCPTLLIPCTTDQMFPMATLQPFARLLREASWAPLVSDKGHFAPALPAGTAEFEFLDQTTARFLDRVNREE